MKIYSWNVNGIRALQRKGLLNWIQEEKPDILCLQETKAHVSQLDDDIININGYYSYFNSPERKGYSGVSIYSKIEPNKIHYGIGINEFDNEGRILIAEYDNFVLLNIYFPNGQMNDERLNYKLIFYDAILDYIDKRKNEGDKLIICGDYNTAHTEIDLKNPKRNENRSGFLPIERQWIDKFISHGFIDTYRYLYPQKTQYSWWSYRFKAREKGIGWRIDYHFVSDNFIKEVLNSEIMDEVMGSDHCPVVLTLK